MLLNYFSSVHTLLTSPSIQVDETSITFIWWRKHYGSPLLQTQFCFCCNYTFLMRLLLFIVLLWHLCSHSHQPSLLIYRLIPWSFWSHTEKAIEYGHLQILRPRFSVNFPWWDNYHTEDGKRLKEVRNLWQCAVNLWDTIICKYAKTIPDEVAGIQNSTLLHYSSLITAVP